MTIRTKFIVILVVILVLGCATLGFNYYTARQENAYMRHLLLIQQEHVSVLNIEIAVLNQIKEAIDAYVLHEPVEANTFPQASRRVQDALRRTYAIVSNQMEPPASSESLAIEHEELRMADRIKNHLVKIDQALAQIGRLYAEQEYALVNLYFATLTRKLVDEQLLSDVNVWINREQEESDELQEKFTEAIRRHNIMLVGSMFLGFLVTTILSAPLIMNLRTRLDLLIQGTKRIARGDLTTEIDLPGRDEMSILADGINSMTRRLANTQKAIIEQSYYSGRAELVSGILHNIKNAFAPFVVDIEFIEDKLDRLRLDRLRMAVTELGRDDAPADRRKDLLEYVELSCADLETRVGAVRALLRKMHGNIRLIEQVMTLRKEYAHAERPLEFTRLDEVVEDSFSLVNRKFLDRIPVTVHPSVRATGTIRTQRVVLMQVFANVITNAIESILKTESGQGEVRIEAAHESIDGEETVHVTVSDTGAGFPPEDRLRLFEQSYSGKERKSGLGLHWCANSIVALGGRMYAESEGSGRGARIHLVLGAPPLPEEG